MKFAGSLSGRVMAKQTRLWKGNAQRSSGSEPQSSGAARSSTCSNGHVSAILSSCQGATSPRSQRHRSFATVTHLSQEGLRRHPATPALRQAFRSMGVSPTCFLFVECEVHARTRGSNRVSWVCSEFCAGCWASFGNKALHLHGLACL